MTPILIVNGPNLNLLGRREPGIYGSRSLDELGESCREHGRRLGLAVDFRQSNHEGVLVDWVQEATTAFAGLVVNAGAYSHTSVALLDALRAVDVPIVEVHLSNIFRREGFRHHSYPSLAATGVICGLGPRGYLLALEALAELTRDRAE
jgi:3-dehydroquinate dehydratase II